MAAINLWEMVPATLPQGNVGRPEIRENMDVRAYSGRPFGPGVPFAGQAFLRKREVPPGWENTHYYNRNGVCIDNVTGLPDAALLLPTPRAMSGQRLGRNNALVGDRTINALLASTSQTDALGDNMWGVRWDEQRFPLPDQNFEGYMSLSESDALAQARPADDLKRAVKVKGNVRDDIAEEQKYRTELVRLGSRRTRMALLVREYNRITPAGQPRFPRAAAELPLDRLRLQTAWGNVQAEFDRKSAQHYEYYRRAHGRYADRGALGLGPVRERGGVDEDAVQAARINAQLNKLWNVANETRAMFMQQAGAAGPNQRYAAYGPNATPEQQRAGMVRIINRALNSSEMWDFWQIVASLSDTLAAHYQAHLAPGDPMPWMNFPGLMQSLHGLDVPFVDPHRIMAGDPELLPNPHTLPGVVDNRPLVGDNVHPRYRTPARLDQKPHLVRHGTHITPGPHSFNGRERGHVPGPPYLQPKQALNLCFK